MEPGKLSKSELFHSLKVYLNNKNRLQPIIGLGSITECVKMGTSNRDALYLCEVCVCRLSKADVRNHIMGSLHRFNYIKAWHPNFVEEWKENPDLSNLAWPLMEMAKLLEKREGPGDVQVLEFDEALYWKLVSQSESDAVALINSVRHWEVQSENTTSTEMVSAELESCTVQPERIVFPPHNHQGQPKKPTVQPLKAAEIFLGSTTQTNKHLSLIQTTVAPSLKTKPLLKEATVSLMGSSQLAWEPSVLSEKCSSLLDGYTGTKPLIGLHCVVECRSEDGHTHCFLCHCCRVRSNKKDMIDHLTSSSHFYNYLVEVCPDQVEVLTADMDDCSQLLESLAKKVEEREGRGELTVVNLPKSCRMRMSGKSYHWCVKMLSNGNRWTNKNFRKRKRATKGPVTNKTSYHAAVPSKWSKMIRNKKKPQNATRTVFNVSLPMTKGSLLLERTSFSLDIPLSPTYSPSHDPDLIFSPELDGCDSESFDFVRVSHGSQVEPHVFDGDTDMEQYGDMDDYFCDGENLIQTEEVSGTETHQQTVFNNQYHNAEAQNGPPHPSVFHGKQFDRISITLDSVRQKVYHEMDDESHHCDQERSIANVLKEWRHEYREKEKGGLIHNQDWSSPYYMGEEMYRLASQSATGVQEKGTELNLDDTQQYYYQQPYMAQNNTHHWVGSMWHPDFSGERAHHFNANGANVHPHSQAPLTHSGNIVVDNTVETTIGYIYTAPQSYMLHPVIYQDIPVGHKVRYDSNYSNQPVTKSDQHFPHPVTSSPGDGHYPLSSHLAQPGVMDPILN
ncbi:uncharacterized protein si:ch211-199g17.2 isoform X2 [Thalassophryne amazonica]|uniref:uncharacterized protein si:ch211-199g17.2 isoform X2 n=1 Tax=Thalassophryne amazonica TaxID=390379 RepID=UPI001471DD99|nr:uncharacterized protein si:ch211-199g17.2 isoform X2 [Thalassophryne amazonica]